MTVLVLLHLLVALLAVPAVRRWGSPGVLVTAVAPAAVVVWLCAVWAADGAGATRSETHPWAGSLGLDLAWHLDPLAALLALVVSAVGVLVLVYSAGYFAGAGEAAARRRTVPMLVAFAGAMLGLVLADDVVLLYVCWELTTVLSWLLVGQSGRSADERRSALHALLVTTAGGLALLVGVLLLAREAGTTRISALLAEPPPGGPAVTVAALLLLAGAVSKSALLPVTAWLPGAMVAPTPVSAYLHAAAMVKAGVYLVARFSPVFTDVPAWRVAAVAVGGATMVVGAWRALRQHDLKLVLAHGTVSELGFMVALLGSGLPTAQLAGAGLLVAHALFKSSLFMVAGAVDHVAGTRDLRELSGLHRPLRGLFVLSCLSAASMAGLPPTLGFVTHEAAFEAHVAALEEGGDPSAAVVLAVLVAGSVLTAAYSARFVHGAFGNRPGAPATEVHRPGAALVLPAAAGAVGGTVLGIAPGAVDALAARAVGLTDPDRYHVALWHGPTPALALSAVAVGGGALLFAARGAVARAQARATPRLADDLWRGRTQDVALRALERTGTRTTLLLQRGSLPQYVLVVALAFVAGPGTGLVLSLTGGAWPADWRLWDAPLQLPLVLVCLAAAVATAAVRDRRSAFLLVGVSGYALAGLFVVAGAPDLALTQALVESVTLAVAVLVLRRLPPRFAEPSGPGTAGPPRSLRLVAAVGSGAVAGLLAAVALGARQAGSLKELLTELAVSRGGGENVVDVVLVDVRAWDTFGEITVLTAAATGVASMVWLRRRTGRAPRLPEGADAPGARPSEDDLLPGPDATPSRAWLTGARGLPPARRSAVLEVAVRALFGVVLVLSVHLLLVGHQQPGGGFAAGLVAGLALFLRYLAGGRFELGEAARVDAGALLGAGLLVASLSGAVPLVLGGQVMQSAVVDVHLPVLGDLHLSTSMFFDVGVYLVVVATVLDVLRSLGAGVDEHAADDDEPSEDEPSGGEPPDGGGAGGVAPARGAGVGA
ncbi:Na+/H+ antiporter subunit A [Kineococcus sp. SYSU DK004]|uniref:Na+/H+ antiporter subunit A n=1 Tax=Kineococcus sp. SYSU DK004 TaxID=3383125 RepID=UPI003D7CC56D